MSKLNASPPKAIDAERIQATKEKNWLCCGRYTFLLACAACNSKVSGCQTGKPRLESVRQVVQGRGVGITDLLLEPDPVLAASGEDLRDFFCLIYSWAGEGHLQSVGSPIVW